LKTGIIKKRLRETFGDDVQETVASKLNMSQSNVSKLLSGNQTPTAEVIKNVSNAYRVSVDWLLGLSDEKRLHKNADTPTYEDAVKLILDLEAYGVIHPVLDDDEDLSYDMKDFILKKLLQKGRKLRATDKAFYQSWRETRLSEFDGREVLSADVWEADPQLEASLVAASDENDLAAVYYQAVKREQEHVNEADPISGHITGEVAHG
jgi:transcriptional regulator with XRE-family HTH domain